MAKRGLLFLAICMLSLASAFPQQGNQRNEGEPLASYCQRQFVLTYHPFEPRVGGSDARIYQFRLDLPHHSFGDTVERIRRGELIWGRNFHGIRYGFGYKKPMVNRYENSSVSGSWPRSPEPRPGAFDFEIRFK